MSDHRCQNGNQKSKKYRTPTELNFGIVGISGESDRKTSEWYPYKQSCSNGEIRSYKTESKCLANRENS